MIIYSYVFYSEPEGLEGKEGFVSRISGYLRRLSGEFLDLDGESFSVSSSITSIMEKSTI